MYTGSIVSVASDMVLAFPFDDNPLLPPEGWNIGYFHYPDPQGVPKRIRYGMRIDNRAPLIVDMSGGYDRPMECYFPAIRQLQKRGFSSVFFMEWPGYGGCERFDADDPSRAPDVDFAWHAQVKHYFVSNIIKPDRRLAIVTHSMGGNKELRRMHAYKDTGDYDIQGAFLGAPLFKTRMEWLVDLRHAPAGAVTGPVERALVDGFTSAREGTMRGLFHAISSPNILKTVAQQHPDLFLNNYSADWTQRAKESCRVIRSPGFLSELRQRVHIASAGLDAVVCNQAHMQAARHLNFGSHQTFRGVRHRLYYDFPNRLGPLWDSLGRFLDDITHTKKIVPVSRANLIIPAYKAMAAQPA